MASINHPSVSRSRKIRYPAPSLSATSHSSRFHPLLAWSPTRGPQHGSRAGGPTPTPDTLAALSWLVGPHISPGAPDASHGPQALHHSPDVRHGPAHAITCPPTNPQRSVVTRTGRPSATATRAGTGCRQRRRAEMSCGWRLVACGSGSVSALSRGRESTLEPEVFSAWGWGPTRHEK